MRIEHVGITCPYCWQPIDTAVDLSGLPARLVEDCTVCCQPMVIDAGLEPDGTVCVQVVRENE